MVTWAYTQRNTSFSWFCHLLDACTIHLRSVFRGWLEILFHWQDWMTKYTSMDVTEWQNTPSMDGTECLEWAGVGSETETELLGLVSCTPWWLLWSIGIFSAVKHFLRIPIKNVISLDRTFGVSMFMNLILTLYFLYFWSFHLRKHLKEAIGLCQGVDYRLIYFICLFWPIGSRIQSN